MKTCIVCNKENNNRMSKTCSIACAKQRVKKTKSKPSKVKLFTLQAKADTLMSEYIRRKYSDEHGYVKCVSCGRIFRWQEVDCGHFIPKSRGAAIRYVEENVHPECRGCNRFDEGHLIGYTLYMLDMYSKSGIEELKADARKVLTPSQKRSLVEEAISYYSKRLDELNV